MRNVLPAALAGLLVLAALSAASAADLDADKRLVREYIDTAINKRQPDAVGNYLAAEFVEHNPRLPPGLAGKKQFVTALLAGFSDHDEIQEMLAEGDKIITRTRWTGTQDGPFLGRPATGNKLDFTTANFFRIENGRIVEHWDVVDTLARAVALGLVAQPK
jgi:predicted ester cyclase